MEERRIHKVFITRNTEYHLRRERCVAVRDRRTGEFRAEHSALYQHLAGALQLFENGSLAGTSDQPRPGDALLFDGAGGTLTSTVLGIERPARHVVAAYPL